MEKSVWWLYSRFFLLPFLGTSAFFALLDTFPTARRFRFQIPDFHEIKKAYAQTWKLVICNLIFHFFFMKGLGYVFPIKETELKFSEVIVNAFIFALTHEISFNFLHLISHRMKSLFQLHSIHHQMRITVAIGALYAHPLDYLITGFGTWFLCFYIRNLIFTRKIVNVALQYLGVDPLSDVIGHQSQALFWFMIALLSSTAHSGYFGRHPEHHLDPTKRLNIFPDFLSIFKLNDLFN
jgi:sterol desaturase/sphingolipid hydroxylase (fatty acid hydroxylase superfamily)